jgi:serine/threonine-protein kinase
MWNLRHFAIPSVRDLIKLGNGSLALVMSYIPGPTLAKIVEKYGRMDAEHVAWIAHRVINALMYMHSGGVIHGDIKPQNIIVQHQDHTIVIVDFGLAMIKPKRDDQSKGYTKLFSPPEQMDGGVLIPESDLYSLGMTMIYALSGGTKHGTENLEKQRVPNDVPKPLCEFIRRLVRPEPLDRPRVWKEENLFLTLEQVRMESFGRTNSGMKPLEIDL